jgi:hypothetical protein
VAIAIEASSKGENRRMATAYCRHRPYVPLRSSIRPLQMVPGALCLHRRCMASPDVKSAMPRRHVVGLSLIAAIAVVLTGSIVVRALPLGADGQAPTPAVAQAAVPTTMPPRVAPVQAPAPADADAPATAGTPTQLPAPPPPLRTDNPPRRIASIRERPPLPPLRARQAEHPPRAHGHSHHGRPRR